MSNVTWEFFGGINTIGGTIIAIECERHRLIFDLGRLDNPSVPIFDRAIQARSIRDLQKMGMAPRIPGLFAGDGTEASDGVQTMVAVSHSHLDHVGLLPYLRSDIPLLVTEDTHKLLLALDDVTTEWPGQPLNYQPVQPGSTTRFGPFSITVLLVDHDTPGACGLLIETPELRFAYTGDLRLHGAHPERTRTFMEMAREFRPDVLFIEGTRAKSEDNQGILQETELQDRLIEVVRGTEAGVYFTYYHRNPHRLTAFAEAAKATGRQLVVDAESAYLYEKFGGDVGAFAILGGVDAEGGVVAIGGLDAEDGLAFESGSDVEGITNLKGDSEGARTVSGSSGSGVGSVGKWTATAKRWVEASGLPLIEAKDLHGQEANYIVELPYHRFIQLLDINPQPGGCFIHSNGAPLGPYDPAWDNFQFWLEHFGLTFTSVGSTGHGSRGDMLAIIEAIRPRVLMPIHSFTPELIGLPTVNRIMPAYGKRYTKADLEQAVPPTVQELEVQEEQV